MIIPCSTINPIEIMAVIGLARITGAKFRWSDGNAESQCELDPAAIVESANEFAGKINSDDVDNEWRNHVTVAMAKMDRERLSWLSAIASDDGRAVVPSRFRFAFGQQKWLKSMRRAAERVTTDRVAAWLSSANWPRDSVMTMCGWDSRSFTPGAYRWNASNTSNGSLGNPVGLYLACESLVAWPCLGGKTTAWNGYRVRIPIWSQWKSWAWIRSAVANKALHGRMNDKIVVGDDWEPDQYVTTRSEYLRSLDIASVMQCKVNRPSKYQRELSACEAVL